jgi:Peptidase family M28/PA domain
MMNYTAAPACHASGDRVRILTLLFALVSSLCIAQSVAPQFQPEAVRAHVAFLADDLLEGRQTGTRGYEIAARYVAAQFESYGLKPAGEDGWFQRITFQRTSYLPNRAAMTLLGPGGEQRYAHGDNVLVGLNVRKMEYAVEAPLVFVGYGMQNKRFGFDDYRGLNAQGKIVVVLSGFPKGMPSEEGAHLASTKVENAEAQGAIGVITIDTLESGKSNPWKRAQEYAFDPVFSWVGKDGLAHMRAPGIVARAKVHSPVAEALFSDAPRKLQAVLREADKPMGHPRGFALKGRLQIESAGSAERVTSPNVVGLLPGSDPTLSKQYVVLSAHLDHLGITAATRDDPKTDLINNGALDNAAGIATTLEVARALASAPTKPRRSILFIATTAEEEGLLGADYFAQHPTVPIKQIVGNVDLDMPLLLYPFTDVIAFGANHSTLGPLVAKAAGEMNIALAPDPMPEQGIFTRSDHYMFVKQGVAAVFLATGFSNGGEKHWAQYLAGPYHHANDDLTQAIDWQAGARFAEVNYRITRAMADADTAPKWNEGDFFGETFAPANAN